MKAKALVDNDPMFLHLITWRAVDELFGSAAVDLALESSKPEVKEYELSNGRGEETVLCYHMRDIEAFVEARDMLRSEYFSKIPVTKVRKTA